MSFDAVAEEIVRNSIRTAYAIDDEFVEPYTMQRGNREISKKLFSSFKNAGCTLEIARFSGLKKWEKDQSCNLEKKDLLILDWELNKYGIKFKNTLHILMQAIKQPGLPFICIYTHAQDLDVVAQNIYSFFNYSEKQDKISSNVNSFIDSLDEKIDSFDEDVFKVTSQSILEILRTPTREKEILKRIGKVFFDKFGNTTRDIIIEAGKEFFNTDDLKSTLLYFSLSGESFLKSGKRKSRYFINAVEGSNCPFSILINNALVQIFQKVGRDHSVEPEQLYNQLSSAICKRPNNFVSLLGLEFRNYFRDRAKLLGRELNAISEDAFFYHQSCVNGTDEGNDNFSFFMKDIWNSQITGDWQGHSPKTLDVIENYKEAQKFDETLIDIKKDKGGRITNDLAFLNKRYSILNWSPIPTNALRFGDIFKTTSPDVPYVLCITSHCDCLRPLKVDDCFLFVPGTEITLRQGLIKGDEGYQSFVRDDGNLKCLDWSNKPFSLFIKSADINLNKPLSVVHKGKVLKLTFICTQKENYTQRVANNAFGNAGRVGITLASLREFKDQDTAD